MKKKIIGKIKLALNGGNATPIPPLGPALGQYGVNIALFCKEYNFRTQNNLNQIIPAEITIFEDKSFSFILKTQPTTKLILQFANIKKGSSLPNTKIIGFITNDQLEQIIKLKLIDLNTNNFFMAKKIICGTLNSMGIKIF